MALLLFRLVLNVLPARLRARGWARIAGQACKKQDLKRLAWALDAGLCPNTVVRAKPESKHLLVVALEAGFMEGLALLLQRGADPMTTVRSLTSFLAPPEHSRRDHALAALPLLATLERSQEMAKALIDAGADVDRSTAWSVDWDHASHDTDGAPLAIFQEMLFRAMVQRKPDWQPMLAWAAAQKKGVRLEACLPPGSPSKRAARL